MKLSASKIQTQLFRNAAPSRPTPLGSLKSLQGSKGKATATKEMQHLFPGLYAGKASSAGIAPKHHIQQETLADPKRKRLYKAAQDFQAIFIGQMLKAMRKNLNPKSDPLYGGNRQEIFEDMLYNEYAKGISKSKGFTLSDQIYEQLSRSLPPIKNRQSSHARVPHPSDTMKNRYIPGQAGETQKYATERLQSQIKAAKNRISTDELYREGDWRP